MNGTIKKMIKFFVPQKFITSINNARRQWEECAFESYSQEGEDMILRRVLEDPQTGQLKQNGFYIDIGAHHPKRYSNSYFFYKKGWMGINIDAMPGSMKLFRDQRPRDINLEIAISEENGERTFYIFNEPLLNSFDEKLSRSSVNNIHKIIETRLILTRTLKDVLSNFLPKGIKVDFLSIDVEGLDIEVLQSNDWNLLRPKYILIECFGMTLHEIFKGDVFTFLEAHHYEFLCKTINTVFFKNTVNTSIVN